MFMQDYQEMVDVMYSPVTISEVSCQLGWEKLQAEQRLNNH